MLSEAKIESPVKTFRRSLISSWMDSGRPKTVARVRASPRPSRVLGTDAASFATSSLGPDQRKNSECGRAT